MVVNKSNDYLKIGPYKNPKDGESRRNTANYVYCRSSTDQQNSTYWINSINRNYPSGFFLLLSVFVNMSTYCESRRKTPKHGERWQVWFSANASHATHVMHATYTYRSSTEFNVRRTEIALQAFNVICCSDVLRPCSYNTRFVTLTQSTIMQLPATRHICWLICLNFSKLHVICRLSPCFGVFCRLSPSFGFLNGPLKNSCIIRKNCFRNKLNNQLWII